jgi:hypothetical protein
MKPPLSRIYFSSLSHSSCGSFNRFEISLGT